MNWLTALSKEATGHFGVRYEGAGGSQNKCSSRYARSVPASHLFRRTALDASNFEAAQRLANWSRAGTKQTELHDSGTNHKLDESNAIARQKPTLQEKKKKKKNVCGKKHISMKYAFTSKRSYTYSPSEDAPRPDEDHNSLRARIQSKKGETQDFLRNFTMLSMRFVNFFKPL